MNNILRSLILSDVLSFDGKKLAPGLTKENKDIDLFGYEMEESLQNLRLRLKTEKDVVTSTRDSWLSMNSTEKCEKLQKIVLIVSERNLYFPWLTQVPAFCHQSLKRMCYSLVSCQ
jgi:hypothetical protein